MTFVLDAEAFSMVARTADRPRVAALAVLHAALADDDEVLVPAAVLAELYRGQHHDQVVDACLSRFPAIVVVDTDRVLAREIGHVLARAGRGSADHVDASVVAVAVLSGGGAVVTADVDDFSALAAGVSGVRVEGI